MLTGAAQNISLFIPIFIISYSDFAGRWCLSVLMGLSSVFVCLSSSAVFYRPIRLQARTVIQQCSHAKIKLKPAVDGADAQWAEVGAFVFQCILFN